MIPPPPTLAADPCMNIGFGGFQPPAVPDAEIRNIIYNGNSFDIKLEWLNFYWPDPNGKLLSIELDGSEIYDDPTDPPMVQITSFRGDPTIKDMSGEDIVFFFENVADPSGYWIEAMFVGIGCYISDGM